ncbi:LysR family transcriptional regulator [Halioxenophilus aromaticivorans]|uniref:LysR family transcriptional regulator n=1 Tax=Halioxenophilus aromaticivorans TaxID=1306992 RepID=A0AAV3TY65_9ALTE
MDSKVNITRLKYLYEANRHGTMNAASEAMEVAASSVTRQIATLEQELGIDLIEKGRRGVKLTQAGQLAIDHFIAICAQEEVFFSHLDSFKSLQKGVVKIAIGEGFMSPEFNQRINRFIAKYSGIDVDVLLAKSNHIIELVKQDEIHFGLIFDVPRDPAIREKLVLDQPIKVLLPKNHRLADEPIIKLSDLTNENIALPNRSYRIRQVIDIAERLISPTVTTNSIHLMKDFVISGGGISFLPDIAAMSDILGDRLISRKTDNELFNSTKISLVTRLGRQLPEIADLLSRRIQAHLNDTVKALKDLEIT